MREGTEGVARCQPLRVADATFQDRLAVRSGSGTARCTEKCAKTARFSTRQRQLLCASTKCHSSTAENSPNRSWISRSDHSRKIQLVVRRRCPPPQRPGPTPRMGVPLHEDVPPLVAALQLPHVLGAVMAWEGSAHSSVG